MTTTPYTLSTIMDSMGITARQITELTHALGSPIDVEPMTGGLFATTFRVTLTPEPTTHQPRTTAGAPTRVIVKIGPSDPTRVLTYERAATRTERDMFQLGETHPQLLFPRLLHSDTTHTVVPGDVIITEELTGQPWASCPEHPWDDPHITAQLHRYAASLHRVTGDRFGYPHSDLSAATWTQAFGLALTSVLDDANRAQAPVPAERIAQVWERHRAHLDVVTTAHLIHTDLWPGNVFLDERGNITGIIDAERALYGDPLFEFVGMDQLGTQLLSDTAWQRYSTQARLSGGQALAPATEQCPAGVSESEHHSAVVRFLLYRLYMFSILTTELSFRHYEGDWVVGHSETVQRGLADILLRLEEI